MTYRNRFAIIIVGLFAVSLAMTGCSHTEEKISESKQKEQSQNEPVETVLVSEQQLKRTVRIPSELAAFRVVEIYPKVQGFVKTMSVDRGSAVKAGQILVEIVAPELEANYREAEAKFEAVESSLLETQSKIASLIAQKEEAEAKLGADEANYKRIQIANKTPGAVAPTDIETAEKKVQGDRAKVRAAEQTVIACQSALEAEKDRVRAAKQALNSVREMKGYLTVRAPFDGVITERNVHEGSLVSSSPSNPPMLKVEQISPLRLLVPVPENAIAGMKNGAAMQFTCAAYVGKTFYGTVLRLSHELDRKTRSMVVELDVPNKNRELEPGMFAEVIWHMERPYRTLFVPALAVLSKEDKTYVIVIKDSKAELIQVDRGQPMGKLVEIVGSVKTGDEVVLKPSSDLVGAKIQVHRLSNVELKELLSESTRED